MKSYQKILHQEKNRQHCSKALEEAMRILTLIRIISTTGTTTILGQAMGTVTVTEETSTYVP